MQASKVNTYVIDLFCGAGGTSEAIGKSNTNIKVIWCVNHDKNAIVSHMGNHDCKHSIEDIRSFNLTELVALVEKLRRDDPTCKIAIWASLECIFFSIARQGPKNQDNGSRTLANDLFRYLLAIDPDFLWIENVKGFKKWGPLDEHGKPIKSREGEFYDQWVKRLTDYFFQKEYYEESLISADYGGRTIRDRLFLQFAKDSNEIGTPIQTHSKDGSIGLPWLPVKDVLDLHNFGASIFSRQKPYVPNTHKNIFNGLVKHKPTNGMEFGYTYYGNSGFAPVYKPAPTLTTKDRISMVSVAPLFINQQYGTATSVSLERPFNTLTTRPKGDLISVKRFIINPQYGGSTRSAEDPAGTVIARQDKAPLGLALSPGHNLDSVLRRVESGTEHIKYEDDQIIYTIFESDDEWMAKIKGYMYENNLLDVLVRPLTIVEMLRIQGFPEDYYLAGTQTEQKRYIGNSVEVEVGISLFESIDIAIQKNAA